MFVKELKFSFISFDGMYATLIYIYINHSNLEYINYEYNYILHTFILFTSF